jgi:GNAT superfamily N-acetyltransferase
VSRPACKTLNLTIRRAANASDIADAAEIYVRSGTAAFAWRPPDYFKAEDFKLFAEQEEVWLALMGEAVVGVLSLFPAENFIHCLYVDPDAQGLGIGRSLVAHLRRQTGRPMTLKLDTLNRAAIAFYEATGWQRLRGPDDSGEDAYGISWARYRLE